MAGDWTAIEHATPKKSEIACIAHDTGRSRHEVLGLLVEFWSWVETETDTGTINQPLGTLPHFIGADMQFWCAVVRAGWIVLRSGDSPETCQEFTIPRADHWLSKGAKARLIKNRRQSKWRRSGRRRVDAPPSTKASTTEEKRTEEKRSPASAGDNPLPPSQETPPVEAPEFNDHAERDEPDWLIIEAEFIGHWNALEGIAIHSRNSFEGSRDMCLAFREWWRDPGWRKRAEQAMAKFPLKNGVRMGLRKFLEPNTIDEILGGIHDFEPGKKSGKHRNGAGQSFDPASVGAKPTVGDF